MRDQRRPAQPVRNANAPGEARPGFSRAGLLHFVSLAAVMSAPAALADTTISDDRTTGVATSTVNGGAPDNIIVSSSGSIDVSSGAAVTVDSNHDVSNAGELGSTDDSNTTGILIEGGVTSDITITGQINLDENYSTSDSDSDGDHDTPFAQGNNRVGIWLQGPGALTGNIDLSAGASMLIEGNTSAAIRLDSLLDGDLTSYAAITVTGNDSIAFDINQGVTGDVEIGGTVQVQGIGSAGVDITGDVGGAFTLRGGVSVTGFRSTSRPTSQDVLDDLDADDLGLGGPAVAVRASVAGGVLIDGVGVEDDEDDDGDGATEEGADPNVTTDNDLNDDLTASIQSFGSAPALLITTSGADVALSAIVDARDGFNGFNVGLANRGGIIAAGVYDNIEATAIRIEGLGGDTVTVAGGFLNDGTITAAASEANATALYIGQDAIVPAIVTRNRISSVVSSVSADTAYGVRIASGATVASFDNRGLVEAELRGDEGDAIAFIDETGDVATINNSGTISATIDNGVEAFTGDAVAIDVSANTTGVTLTQLPTITFTDDDGDNAASVQDVAIIGDIRFGSGGDTLDVQSGTITGDIFFGAGADELFISGGAVVSGILNDTGGDLVIDVQDGELALTGGTLDLTSANFGADSILRISISSDPLESTLVDASGTITFAAGATVAPVLLEGLPVDGSVVFLQAGSLVGGANVEQVLSGEGVPWVYNIEIAVSAGDPNALEARYALKTAAELGLNANETAAFAPLIDALRLDDAASAAFANLDSEEDFFEAFNDMLPNFSSASAELALTAISRGQSATTNRLAGARMGELRTDSAWIQEIAFAVERDAPSFGVDYEGSGFGFAAGFDGPLAPGMFLGLSAAFTTSEVEETDREGTISASFGQVNAYLGGGLGPLQWDIVAGGGAGFFSADRQISFGGFSAETEAEWMGYEGHAMGQVGLPLRLGDRFSITPRASIVYIGLREDGYEEEGGGVAIDLVVDESTTTRMWSDAVVDIAWRFGNAAGGGAEITPKLSFGYRANIADDPAERTVRFGAGGTPFTLIDEEIGEGGPLLGFSLTGGNDHTQVSLIYEGEFADTIDRHSFNAALRFRF